MTKTLVVKIEIDINLEEEEAANFDLSYLKEEWKDCLNGYQQDPVVVSQVISIEEVD